MDAALAAGIRVPYSCKGGMCCTCRAKLVEGKAEMTLNYSLEPTSTFALPPRREVLAPADRRSTRARLARDPTRGILAHESWDYPL